MIWRNCWNHGGLLRRTIGRRGSRFSTAPLVVGNLSLFISASDYALAPLPACPQLYAVGMRSLWTAYPELAYELAQYMTQNPSAHSLRPIYARQRTA
jgi:hypothetical protein